MPNPLDANINGIMNRRNGREHVQVRRALAGFMAETIFFAATYCESDERKIVTASDIRHALKIGPFPRGHRHHITSLDGCVECFFNDIQ